MQQLLNRLGIRQRMWMIVAISAVGILLLEMLSVVMLRDSLWEEREQKTQEMVESAFGVLLHFHARQQSGELSEQAAKQAAASAIRAMRYGKQGYFWLQDVATPYPRMIMHPTAAELEGRLLDSPEFVRPTRQFSARGEEKGGYEVKNIFVAFVESAERADQGFVAYEWPKPTPEGGATTQAFLKLSFIKKFDPWGWAIGSGVYVDDFDATVRAAQIRQTLLIAGIGLLLTLVTLFMTRSIVCPLRKVIATMQATGWGSGDRAHRLPVQGGGEIADLASGFNEMLGRLEEQQQAKQIDKAFRHLDAALLQWQMDTEAVAQIFCDDILPIFDLTALWIGRVEQGGQLGVLAGAETGEENFIRHLQDSGLPQPEAPPGKQPLERAVHEGVRQLLTLGGGEDDGFPWPMGATAALVLPLLLRGKTWGTLVLYAREMQEFEGAHSNAGRLSDVASRLAITLECALQQEWLTLLDTALDRVGNSVLVTDQRGAIIWANSSAARLTGYSVQEMIGKTPHLFSSGLLDATFYEGFWETISSGKTWRGDVLNSTPDGRHYTATQTVTPLLNALGEVSHYVAILDDVTERKAMEERIRHSANYDLLTDLPNRGLFFDRFMQCLAHARRNDGTCTLFFLDLDGFKRVNDQFGHAAGDYLLIEVGKRLSDVVRESDTVARLAGDEFTIILPELGGVADICKVAEKVLSVFCAPISYGEHELKVGASIGIARFPDDGGNAEDILLAADTAMYQAKKSGRNCFVFASKAEG